MTYKDEEEMQDAYNKIPLEFSNRYAFLMFVGYGCLVLL